MNAAERLGKRADALMNRTRLLQAAQESFAQAGLDLEVNDIISQVQMGVGTFYRHFGSRENLLRAIVAQTLEDAHAQISQAIEPYGDDPRAALQALVTVQLQVYQRYRPLFATMRDRRLTKLFDAAQREALYALVLDPPRRVIEQGMQAEVFRQDLHRDLAAALIIGSFTSVFDLLGDNYPFEELEQQLFQSLWTMLTK